MPTTTPICVTIACAALATPRSRSGTAFATDDARLGDDAPSPRPEHTSATTINATASRCAPNANTTIDATTSAVPASRGEPLPHSHREVAGDGCEQAERQGPAQHHVARRAERVVEDFLHQQRRNDEATHVREVRTELSDDRRREVRSPEELEREQRVRGPLLRAHESHEREWCDDHAREHGRAGPTPYIAAVEREQAGDGSECEQDRAGDVDRFLRPARCLAEHDRRQCQGAQGDRDLADEERAPSERVDQSARRRRHRRQGRPRRPATTSPWP